MVAAVGSAAMLAPINACSHSAAARCTSLHINAHPAFCLPRRSGIWRESPPKAAVCAHGQSCWCSS